MSRDLAELLGVDRWIGGTHLTPDNTWRWHPTKQKLVPPSYAISRGSEGKPKNRGCM
jgi:hypothetical protein